MAINPEQVMLSPCDHGLARGRALRLGVSDSRRAKRVRLGHWADEELIRAVSL